MDLQRFVLELVAALGGIGDVKEYSLADVALPAEFSRRAGLPEFATLAFDSDVARETPGAELVTFGSHVLDAFVAYGRTVGRAVKRFAVTPSVRVPPNLLERLESRISFVRSRRPSVRSTTIEAHESASFRFIVTYTSDEKLSDSVTVAVDCGSLSDDTALLPEWNGVFFTDDPGLTPPVPLAARRPYEEVLRAAKARFAEMAKPQFDVYQRQAARFCREELVKVLRYYDSTLLSLTTREEGTEDAQKRERLRVKTEVARTERERRIADVLNKYRVVAAARLDGVVFNVMPKVKAVLEVQHKDRAYTQEVFYNLAANVVEPLTCPRCGRRFTMAYPAEDGVFVCTPDEAPH